MADDLFIIDSGHGGVDSGAVGNGIIEKNLVLEISLYQYNRLKNLNVPVRLTRSKDMTLSPSERTKIVRQSGAKTCISNHINAGGGDGCEVIHSISNNGRFAQLIAGELVKEGQNLRRVFSRKGSSGSDYYFMQRETGSVETLIVEYGFLDSKSDDVIQLKTKAIVYAEAVVRAYCMYKGIKYTAPSGEHVENAVREGADAVLPDGVYKKDDDYKAEVKVIQTYLNYWLPVNKRVDADGYYGENTAAAIKSFQANAGLTADSVYGPATKKALLQFYAEKVAKEKAAQKKPSGDVIYHVQAGAFSELANAQAMQKRLRELKIDSVIVQKEI